MLLYNFLIERLSNAGVKHAFGVPGESVAEFYHELWKSKEIELITNTDEAHSGFAADAYARVNGIGCVVVTCGVGASKVINAVQCAYAERSPLVVISGSSGMPRQESERQMFEKITCASIVLDNPVTAGYMIDSAFESLKYYKRPIYIELPRDMAKKSISYDVYKQGTPTGPVTDPEELQEVMEEVDSWVRHAEKPVILAGVELARYSLGDSLVKFAERNNIPITTTTLSKSAVNELHPLFKGIYCGEASKPSVKQLIEDSDCLLTFGVVAIDMLGDMPAKTKKRMALAANIDGLQVRNHSYSKVGFADFCKTVFKREFGRTGISPIRASISLAPFEPVEKKAITTARLFEKINTILNENMAVVCDIGDCTYGAAELVVHSNNFLCPAYYRSMGVAIPGALGVQTASPTTRPIVIVGDGAAQMSLLELSTIANRALNPIVFILNNGGYLTQRIILDGDYNNVRRWKYHLITDVIGAGVGYDVCHEEALHEAVDAAIASKQLTVINVHIAHDGMSPGLRRKTESMVGK